MIRKKERKVLWETSDVVMDVVMDVVTGAEMDVTAADASIAHEDDVSYAASEQSVGATFATSVTSVTCDVAAEEMPSSDSLDPIALDVLSSCEVAVVDDDASVVVDAGFEHTFVLRKVETDSNCNVLRRTRSRTVDCSFAPTCR
jgi:hypothetical protein